MLKTNQEQRIHDIIAKQKTQQRIQNITSMLKTMSDLQVDFVGVPDSTLLALKQQTLSFLTVVQTTIDLRRCARDEMGYANAPIIV
jgi:PP-loop superfamily ATP-utilizing enzyme